jgi:uncharacterized FAD-dependent dehydrogenase
MIKEINMRLLPVDAANEHSLRRAYCRETGESPASVRAIHVLRRSIDARQREKYVNVTLRVFVDQEPPVAAPPPEYQNVSGAKSVTIVGAGPAGLFAALRLIELGVRPVIIERGKDVHQRRKDIARITREHFVDPESNYAFGEGGAGAFSDGKLYTRSHKRGSTEQILQTFCRHGADPSILVDAHPHIGTDRLPRVIENIRRSILEAGGEVHFNTRMTRLTLRGDEVTGLDTQDGHHYPSPVILATGHSARDVYRWLADNRIPVEPKGIAIGLRLEHPQELIDHIRYHQQGERDPYLPAAEYQFVTQAAGRGVYTFCMCPGGFVVPSASGPEQVVVNGMSPAARNSPWANAGIVVEIRPDDLADAELSRLTADAPHLIAGAPLRFSDAPLRPESPLSMMHLQENLERLAWLNAGKRQTAPAQRMLDFTNRRLSSTLPPSSYTPGLIASPMHFWLPSFIARRLQEGLRQFDRTAKGFLTNNAVLIGIETRSSAPLRIPRDPHTLQHPTLRGLYPCGEGAGYAGGIVSAAIDGRNTALLASQSIELRIKS